jgi:tRNA (guanosine-2'-O-)-methyltransferase
MSGSSFRTSNRNERVRQVLSCRQPDLSVVMENIHDHHNVAAILRSSDAVGVSRISLVYQEDQFPDFEKIGARSSAGTRKWLETFPYTSIESCFADLRRRGMKIYASRLDREAISLFDLDLTEPVALVFGNEAFGVSDEAVDRADGTFMIPMVGMVQSLNVSVATAVTLYEAFRQRTVKGFYREPRLAPEDLEQKAAEWLKM